MASIKLSQGCGCYFLLCQLALAYRQLKEAVTRFEESLERLTQKLCEKSVL